MGEESRVSHWAAIIEQVKTPLGFFALALLVIEAIFGATVVFSNMTSLQQFVSLLIMAFLFVVVLVAVIVLTIVWPTHLLNQLDQTTELTRKLDSWVTGSALSDKIDERIAELTKPASTKRTSEA